MNGRVTQIELLGRIASKPFRAVHSVRQQKKIQDLVKPAKDMSFHLTYKGRRIVLDKASSPYEIYEQFYAEQYRELRVRGKNVIDVGGGTADTAIYFAINGARKVYAFEPELGRYLSAKQNLRANKIKNVVYVNKPIRKLDEIDKYCGRDNRVLKCDVEGAEHSIFRNSSSASIRSFERIILEFHDGYLDLKNILEREGFRVQYWFSDYYTADFNGIIIARRL